MANCGGPAELFVNSGRTNVLPAAGGSRAAAGGPAAVCSGLQKYRADFGTLVYGQPAGISAGISLDLNTPLRSYG